MRARRVGGRALALLCALSLAGLVGATGARADGDPASDVLATQSAFVPADAQFTALQQAQLSGLLGQAARLGMALRVAVVASPADLGSVTELWRVPGGYARFLDQELALVYRGTVLVVMPNGYGVAAAAPRAGVSPGTLAARPAPGAELAAATLSAVQGLISAGTGRRLALPRSGAAAVHGSGDPVAWLVFGAGCLLVAAAWTVSLRVRPLGSSERIHAGRDLGV